MQDSTVMIADSIGNLCKALLNIAKLNNKISDLEEKKCGT